MSTKAKPAYTSKYTTYGDGISACGGQVVSQETDLLTLAYVETDYSLYTINGLPLPYMPYVRWVRYSKYQNLPATHPNALGKIACYKWCYGTVSLPTVDWSALESQAINKLYDNLAKVDTINIGVALVEIRETFGGIASTATRLGLAYRNLRRGRISDAFKSLGVNPKTKLSRNDIRLAGLPYRKGGWTSQYHRMHMERLVPKGDRQLSKFAANAWLELQYGWKPLLSDVFGAAEFAANYFHKNSFDIEVRGTAKTRQTSGSSDSNTIKEGYIDALIKYQARLKVTDPNLRLKAGLGLTNPALILWEAVPFSFVVDWFLPVGDALRNFTAMQGYSITESCYTKFWTGGASGKSKNAYYPCSMIKTDVYMKRTTGISFPDARLPSFNMKEALNVNRAITSLALLTQVFKK